MMTSHWVHRCAMCSRRSEPLTMSVIVRRCPQTRIVGRLWAFRLTVNGAYDFEVRCETSLLETSVDCGHTTATLNGFLTKPWNLQYTSAQHIEHAPSFMSI